MSLPRALNVLWWLVAATIVAGDLAVMLR